MLKLNPAQRSLLRSQAHTLNPVVMIGNAGLSDAVLKEININLDAHELVKIRILDSDRDDRAAMMQTICHELDAAPVQHIGKLLVIYRPKKETEAPENTNKKTKAKPVTGFKLRPTAIQNVKKKGVIKNNLCAIQRPAKRKKRQVSAKKLALS